MRLTGDDGQVAGVEAIPFGLLVFVVGTLVVASGWAVVDLKHTLGVATREGARAFVEGDGSAGSEAAAERATEDAVTGLGRDARRLRVTVAGSDAGRCGRVTVVAAYELPVLTVPWLGSLGPGLTVRSRHSELVDPYRSGLPGSARCGR